MLKNPPQFDVRPDFLGSATFRAQHGTVGKFECGFFLPKTEVAKIWILVRVGSPSESPIVLCWRFSCELTAGVDVLVGEEIFHSGYTQWDWGNGPENTLVGEITRLTVKRGDVLCSAISKTRFAITPSALLRSADIVSEQDGNLVIRRVARKGPVCSASADIAFHFGSTYRRGASGELESSVECELVEPAQMRNPNGVHSLLQDVLTVASFAERRVLMVTGWTVSYENGATTVYYRRDFTAPSQEQVDVDNTLISLRDVEEFVNGSLQRFRSLPDTGALKQAIYFALHGQGLGIGDSFVMLFAGIETLLNIFQSVKDGDPPVPADQWEPLFDSISATLGTQGTYLNLPDNNKARLLDNIHGANHAFFSGRFERMCSSQKIDLTDLWPMLGGKSCLYAIRNRIVHGRVFSSEEEWFRVISSKFHLLWTLERSILCILGWPVERSRSSKQSLSQMTLYSTWRQDREYFATAK
jgi:hypothetical protein